MDFIGGRRILDRSIIKMELEAGWALKGKERGFIQNDKEAAERRLSGQDHWLFVRRTQVQLSALI